MSIELQGLRELKTALDDFTTDVQDKAVVASLRKGARPIAKDMRARVPVKSGRLKKSIGTRTKKRGRSAKSVLVGSKKTPYAHLVENGHALVRKGKVYGHVPARPFLRPAFDTQKEAAAVAIRDELRRQVNKLAGTRKAGRLARSLGV